MRVRLKGFIFFLLGFIFIFISLTMWAGVIPWILGLIGVYLVIWKGLIKIIKGEDKRTRSSEIVKDNNMYCPKCGSKLVPNANVCHMCGKIVMKKKGGTEKIDKKFVAKVDSDIPTMDGVTIGRKKNMRKSKKKIAYFILFFLFLLFIAFILYLGYVYGHPEISVKVTGPAEVQQGDQFTYNVTVTNTGDRNLFNVSVSDSYNFRWTGSLSVNESRTFFIEFNNSIEENLINKVLVEGYTKKGWRVHNQYSWTVAMIAEEIMMYNILDAIDEKLIDVEFRGMGFCSGKAIKLKITPKIDFSIKIKVTPGLILINSGSGQNMIVAEASITTIKPEIDCNLEIETYCLDSDKSNPSSYEILSIQTDSGTYGGDVVRLMKSLENISFRSYYFSVQSIQIALWVITDDISEEDIRIDYSYEDIEDAKWLLENAGVDITGKNLFFFF